MGAAPAPSKTEEIFAVLEKRAEIAEADARFWERVAMAEGHPLRMRILKTLRNDLPEASSIGMTRLFKKKKWNLGLVAYHTKELAKKGFVEVARTRPRRGAFETFYRVPKKDRRG